MDKQVTNVFELDQPNIQTIPLVFSSPHSGREYTDDFITTSRLDRLTLRRSEDSFVDELYAEAPNCGAPFLKALFPRAYLDPNREAYELDQKMFFEQLPDFVNTKSPRVLAGLGTLPRVIANGDEIYGNKLRFEEAKHRIDTYYFPYHSALKHLNKNTKLKFGKCILIDCHSMPSNTSGHCSKSVDIVLGNKHGKTCANELTEFVEECLKDLGLTVQRNHPYAGGYTTKHYGDPNNNIHTLQIEICRASYMDEKQITRIAEFEIMKNKISDLICALANVKFNF
jgi:N-formylglutamate amidohydrolase